VWSAVCKHLIYQEYLGYEEHFTGFRINQAGGDPLSWAEGALADCLKAFL
jgi:hypothetical protein